MNEATAQVNEFRGTILRNAARYEIHPNEDQLRRLCGYYELLRAWNARLHLVAPCSPSEFATRHVLESLLLSVHLRSNAHLVDVGSGAGLPIIPNLIVRRDIHAKLIEASKKKVVFLREALRNTETTAQAAVLGERFESLPTPAVDYVTCRALDRFSQMLPVLARWSPTDSTFQLFGGEALRKQIESVGLTFVTVKVPKSDRRFLFVCENRVR